MTIRHVDREHRLRICVVGDLAGAHTRSWIEYFVKRGHDIHGVSYYGVSQPPSGLQVTALRPGGGDGTQAFGSTARWARNKLPADVQRFANLLRYRRAGLAQAVDQIAPDVLHAHYLVEHAFYATSAKHHPYVVSAWGSDVLVDAARSPLSRAIARFSLSRADLATANNRHMMREMILRLEADRAFVQHIVLGVSREFLEAARAVPNPGGGRQPIVLSTRSLDKALYNIDAILLAMTHVREAVPGARLVVAGEGSLRASLEQLSQKLGLSDAVSFVGYLPEEDLRREMLNAQVYVSVPSSDATSVAVLQAMAAGCFPIVSDLPSQQELVGGGGQGGRVPPRDPLLLARAIIEALESPDARETAAEANRAFVENYGVLETNLARMEAWYYRLAGRADEYEP